MNHINSIPRPAQRKRGQRHDDAADNERAVREMFLGRVGDSGVSVVGEVKSPPARLGIGYIILAVFAALVVVWPIAVLTLVLISFWAVLVPLTVFGPAAVTGFVAGRWRALLESRPDTAEALRRAADAFALRYDMVLDYLPPRWAEALALPDLSQPADARMPAGEDCELTGRS